LNGLALDTAVVCVGWPDAFIEHGKQDDLRKKYGLTAEGAMAKAAEPLAKVMESRLVRR
jgi:1-deoxy-D-xylulose-5-phosphate synthase